MSSIDARIAEKLSHWILGPEDLHTYQLDLAIPFLRENPFSALFIDLSMGKTVISLSVICEFLSEFKYDKVLISGPRKVVTETWPDEISNWRHTAPFNYSLIHAFDDDPRVKAAAKRARVFGREQGLSQKELASLCSRAMTREREKIRIERANSPASIHLISRDWLEWLTNYWRGKWPYRAVVFDESSSLKDHKSGRFMALKKIRNTPGLIERLHLLTATPAAESYIGLFPQMYLLDKGERLGKDQSWYERRYFTENKYSHKFDLRPGAKEEILEKIADLCMVLSGDDYLKLDQPVYIPRKVHLSDEQMKFYHKLETTFVVEMPDGKTFESKTSAALSANLQQIASGVLYETELVEDWDTGDLKKVRKVHHIHDNKIDMLKEIEEEAQGQPILVAYHFKSSLDRLKKAFPHATPMDRDGKAIKPWNAGKIPMMLMHPQSGGHGLNLQHGGHIIVFFDIPWSLELFQQYIGRLRRQGQKHAILVYALLAVGTIDEDIWKALGKKKKGQDELFRILKSLIAKLRPEMQIDFSKDMPDPGEWLLAA